MVKFDELLTNLGGFGLYQKRLLVLLLFSYLFYPLQNMLAVFILSSHTHRCREERGLDYFPNSSSKEWSQTYQNSLNFSISPSSCFVTLHNNLTNTTLEKKCTSWSYDTTERYSTPISDFNLVCTEAIKVSHANMVFHLGMLVSSLLAGALGDRFGRKPIICISLIFLCAPSVGIAWTTNIYMYIVLRFLTGVGSNFSVSKLLAIEMVGPNWRFLTTTLFGFASSVSELILCGLAYWVRDWRKLQLFLSVPSVVCQFYVFLLPESVRWLHLHGKIKETHNTLRKISTCNNTPLQADFSIEKDTKKSYNTKDELFRLLKSSILLLRLFITLYMNFTNGLLYIGASLYVGMLEGNVYLNFLVSIVMVLTGKVLILMISGKAGRKHIIQTLFYFTGTLSVVSAICTLYLESSYGYWISLTSAIIARMCGAAGVITMFTFTSELFPTSMRTLAISLNYIVYNSGCMVSPYVANIADLVDFSFGKALPAVIFGTLSAVAGLLGCLLPETLNKDLLQNISDIENKRNTNSDQEEKVWSTNM